MRSGIRGGLGDYAARAYAELDQQSELIRETRTCHKCGSGHFKDRRT
jgi:ribosomal protein S27AE